MEEIFNMAKKVVLAGACRTAIGTMGGALDVYKRQGGNRARTGD